MATSPVAIKRHFVRLPDPRVRGRTRHKLIDIVVIAICGVICGCNTWVQIEKFGKRRRQWLKRFLALPNGAPSHDTFERVFDRLDPEMFQCCFLQWTGSLSAALGIDHVAIDGKTLRRSGQASSGLGPLHVVSAWATEYHLTLGQITVDEKSNEITAIPKLLELLDLHGAFVTIDAMGCQKEIARQIVENGGDYVLTVKDNQPKLLEDIQERFAEAFENDFAGLDYDEHETQDDGHNRHEKRSYVVIRDPAGIRNIEAWSSLRVIGICCSERTANGKTSNEIRYFIGSRRAKAKDYAKVLRNHWRIENCLHWQLDVSFHEDDSRIRKRHAAENFALLRRVALMFLKRHPGKQSIACKRLEAALDTGFLEEVLRA